MLTQDPKDPKGLLLSTSPTSTLVQAATASLTLISYNLFPTTHLGGFLHTCDFAHLLPVAPHDEGPTWSPRGMPTILHHHPSSPAFCSLHLSNSLSPHIPLFLDHSVPRTSHGFKVSGTPHNLGPSKVLSLEKLLCRHWLPHPPVLVSSQPLSLARRILFMYGFLVHSWCLHISIPITKMKSPSRGGALLVLYTLYLGHYRCLLRICWFH